MFTHSGGTVCIDDGIDTACLHTQHAANHSGLMAHSTATYSHASLPLFLKLPTGMLSNQPKYQHLSPKHNMFLCWCTLHPHHAAKFQHLYILCSMCPMWQTALSCIAGRPVGCTWGYCNVANHRWAQQAQRNTTTNNGTNMPEGCRHVPLSRKNRSSALPKSSAC